jgi:DNA-binding transcriptional MerR regulator
MGDPHLTIGELAKRTGVATSALRYYEELGLLPAPGRVSGQRRYPESAVGLVGMILLLRDVGFSLRESKALLGSRTPAVEGWRSLAHRKLADLDEQIAKAQTAKEVITHGLACPTTTSPPAPNPPASSPPASPANPCRKPTHTELPTNRVMARAVLARPPSSWAAIRGVRSAAVPGWESDQQPPLRGRLQRAVGHAVAAVYVNEPRMDASRQVARNVPNQLEHSPAAGTRHCHLGVPEPSAPNLRHSQPAPPPPDSPPTNGTKTRSAGSKPQALRSPIHKS